MIVSPASNRVAAEAPASGCRSSRPLPPRTVARGYDYDPCSNVVEVYIRYLRNKIDKGYEPPLILTRWGEGYMLRGDDEA